MRHRITDYHDRFSSSLVAGAEPETLGHLPVLDRLHVGAHSYDIVRVPVLVAKLHLATHVE